MRMHVLVGVLVYLPVFFTNLDISLRHFVNCMFFLVGILVNHPALERGNKKKKRAAHPDLHSVRGEKTISSAEI